MRGAAASNDTPKPTTTDTKLEPYTVMGVTYDPTTGQAIQPDTGKIAPGGYSVPASGTDTSSGDREALRTGTEDERMAAWAAANPGLAANLVENVEDRRMMNPKYDQAGYDEVKKALDPSYDKDIRTQNFGPVANGVEYGRNLDLQGTAGVGPMEDGALYADMLSGKEKPNAQSFNMGLKGTAGVGPVEDGELYADMLSGDVQPNAQTFKDERMKKLIK